MVEGVRFVSEFKRKPSLVCSRIVRSVARLSSSHAGGVCGRWRGTGDRVSRRQPGTEADDEPSSSSHRLGFVGAGPAQRPLAPEQLQELLENDNGDARGRQ